MESAEDDQPPALEEVDIQAEKEAAKNLRQAEELWQKEQWLERVKR